MLELRQNVTLGIKLHHDDVRFKLRASPVGSLTVFVVDASGSMAARRRMALAKGAVLRLLLRAYQTRDEVALIAFRGAAAEVLLPPTSSVAPRLDALARPADRRPHTPGPGAAHSGTAATSCHARQRRQASACVVISDGRANVPLSPRTATH